MNRTKLLSVLFLSAVLTAMTTVAAGAQAAEPAFVPALLTSLGNEGWSVQERNALANAAGQLDWSGVQGANAEAVALALSLQRRENLQLSATEQAQIALQLALMTAEMRAAGLDEHAAAVTAVSAVRNALGEIQAWMSGGRHGELGQIIRARISAAVRDQVQLAARSQSAGKGPDDREGVGQGGNAGTGMQGPGGAPVQPRNGR